MLKWILVTMGGVWITQAIYFLQAQSFLGFPDGHLTELDRARKQLFPIFIGVCGVAAALTFAAAHRFEKSRRFALVMAVLSPVVTALLWAIDLRNAATLEHGQGG